MLGAPLSKPNGLGLKSSRIRKFGFVYFRSFGKFWWNHSSKNLFCPIKKITIKTFVKPGFIKNSEFSKNDFFRWFHCYGNCLYYWLPCFCDARCWITINKNGNTKQYKRFFPIQQLYSFKTKLKRKEKCKKTFFSNLNFRSPIWMTLNCENNVQSCRWLDCKTENRG